MKKTWIIILSCVALAAVVMGCSMVYKSMQESPEQSPSESATTSPGGSPSQSPTVSPSGSPEDTAKPTTDPQSPQTPVLDDNGIFSDYYADAQKLLGLMSLEEKVGQVLLARCPAGGEVDAIKQYYLGGYVLFGRDFDGYTKKQISDQNAIDQEASKIPLLFAVDEEGGTVVRVSSNPNMAPHKFLSPQDVFAQGGMDGIKQDAIEKAGVLSALGLNVNLAPVSDVSTDPNDFIYDRSFGKDAGQTAEFVKTLVTAQQGQGVGATLKHFPGYGNNVDTHTGIAIDNRSYESFQNSDFVPFKAGIDAGAHSILVSHNIVNCMDSERPSSLSKKVHDILRGELGFTGVIMTDDLAMDAITQYTNGSSPAVEAVLAGNDLLLLTDYQTGHALVLQAVKDGTIPMETLDKAVTRVLSWKYALGLFS